MRLAVLSISLAALLTCFSQPTLAQNFAPHWRFAKGDVRTMRVKLEQTIDQTVRGRKQQIKQTIEEVLAFTASGFDAQGNATISVRYESVSLHSDSPTGTVNYDSTQPAQPVPPMIGALAALVGQGYELRVSPDGRVIAVSGLEKLLAAILAKLNVPDGPARTAVEKTLRQELNEQNLQSNLQNIFAPFPGVPVAVGESWTRTGKLTLGIPLATESTYKFTGRQGQIATIEVSGTCSAPPGASVDLGPMKMIYELHGQLHGLMEIVEQTGWTRHSQTTQTLTGSATIRQPNGLVETVPVTIEARTQIEQTAGL